MARAVTARVEWSPKAILKAYTHDLRAWFQYLACRGLDWSGGRGRGRGCRGVRGLGCGCRRRPRGRRSCVAGCGAMRGLDDQTQVGGGGFDVRARGPVRCPVGRNGAVGGVAQLLGELFRAGVDGVQGGTARVGVEQGLGRVPVQVVYGVLAPPQRPLERGGLSIAAARSPTVSSTYRLMACGMSRGINGGERPRCSSRPRHLSGWSSRRRR